MQEVRAGSTTRGRVLLAGIGLVAAYAVTRLLFIERFPIFSDEATYVRWAQIGLENPAARYMSLCDGKQPLFPWLVMLMMRPVGDPLLAGRLVSVLAGLAGMVGTGTLAGYLFRDRRIGWWAAGLAVLSPFFLFHDRLALYESLTVAVVAWGLHFGVVLARSVRTDAALGLGLVGGAGALTKSSAFFTLAYLPCTLLVFPWRPFRLRRLLAWCGLAALATGLALVIFSVLLATPWFHHIAEKNAAFVFRLSEWIEAPFHVAGRNLGSLGPWLILNLTPPLTLMAVVGLLWGRRALLPRVLLLAAFAMPFGYLVLVGKHLYPRYLVFMTVPLVVLAARAAVLLRERIPGRRGRWAVLALLFLYPAWFDLMIVVSPPGAPLVEMDRWQYLEGEPAGTGARELMTYLRREAGKSPILVESESDVGLYPTCLQIAFARHPGIEIHGIRRLDAPGVWREARERARGRPCFMVLWSAAAQESARAWPLERVWEFNRGREGSYLRLYLLTSKS